MKKTLVTFASVTALTSLVQTTAFAAEHEVKKVKPCNYRTGIWDFYFKS